ncbi:CRISPR-associated endonuclease Cas2 [Vibrio campbellii]
MTMNQNYRRFMRQIVFFDLPMKTREDKRQYVRFRKFLLKDGYIMLQWSVYARLVNGFDDAAKHIRKLKHNLPETGSVKSLMVTEKQFTTMQVLVGESTYQEKWETGEQFLLF